MRVRISPSAQAFFSVFQEVVATHYPTGVAVLARGPLAKGLLSGKYSADSKFADSVRSGWHSSEESRAKFARQIAAVERLKEAAKPGEEMVKAALQFVISHPSAPVAIPGAKLPEQAAMNASAGQRTLSEDEIDKLVALAG